MIASCARGGESSYPHLPSIQGDPWAGGAQSGRDFSERSDLQSSGTLARNFRRKCSGLHIVSRLGLCNSLLHSHNVRITRATGDAAMSEGTILFLPDDKRAILARETPNKLPISR